MAKYATLKAAVEAAIKTNGQQQITGQVLQTQLVNMITSLGKYFQSFGGLATPAGSFTAGDESVTFLAVEAGTYTNFGGAVLDGKTLHILAYDGDWADVDTLIPSGAAFEAALALAIKGSQSGIAEGIADTISAGTAQEFLQRQSGGDGVNCLKRIKGKTIAWNQLVDEDTTEVTIPSGHKYFAIIGGTASVATSDGTAIAVTGGVDVVTDLTLMFGTGNEPSTVAEFEALYPELDYAYNAGVLKSNDAAALLTDGFNQWDEVWENGVYNGDTGLKEANPAYIRSKNLIPVISQQEYYIKAPSSGVGYIRFFNANKEYMGRSASFYLTGSGVFSLPSGAAYIVFQWQGTTYANDICINLSDPSFNGTYEPYWQRVLALRLSELTGIPEGGTEADRVTIAPSGPRSAGIIYDEIVGNKYVKRVGTKIIDGTNLAAYAFNTYNNFRFVSFAEGKFPDAVPGTLHVSTNEGYYFSDSSGLRFTPGNSYFAGGSRQLILFPLNQSLTTYQEFNAWVASHNITVNYALTTPIIYTDLQYADGTPFTMPATILVDEAGTERIQAPEGATTPSAPFCCDSNYSIGVANLVKRLAALENAE